MHRHAVSRSARRLSSLAFVFIAFIASLCWTSVCLAQAAEVKEFDIPAQPLESALRQVAESQHLQILYDPIQVRGVVTQGVKGRYSAIEAIAKLVDGTGFIAVHNGRDAIAIKPKTEDRKTGAQRGASSTGPTILAQAQPQANQTPPTTSRSSDIHKAESIMVTARKREERLIDVPLSVAVVTNEDIDRRGLVHAEDYLRAIPGVNQLDSGYGQTIVIRGIETATGAQNFASGPTLATYFGETPTTTAAGLNGGTNIDLKLVDIERVEVLRGPQGTAFGNSSMGGAVRTIPVAPKVDRFEGKVAAGYSVTSGTGGDDYNIQAVGNIPLIRDKVAIRAVAYQFQHSGFYRNVAGSNTAFQRDVVIPFGAQAFATDEDEVGAYYVKGGRIAALFQASDDLRFTLSFLSQKTETNGFPLANIGGYEQTLLQIAPEHTVRGQKGGVRDMNIDIANGVMEYNFGWASLLATYSYTKSGTMAVLPWGSFNFHVPVSDFGVSKHIEHVGEIRLATQFDGAWNFLAGLYAEKVKDELLNEFLWIGDPATNFFATGSRLLGDIPDRRNLKQKALFGEASWEFLPRFTLTGGIRAYEYDRTFFTAGIGPLFGPGGLFADERTKASGSNFRANVSYKLDDRALLYGGWSQGFRLGQPQPGLPAGACDLNGDGIVDGTNTTIESTKHVKSDNLDSYELGGKFALLDRRLTIAADVFRMDWTDIPVRVQVGGSFGGEGCGLSYLTNAGEARSQGVEFQATFQVNRAFRVDFGGSYVDAKLTKDAPALNAFKGARLPSSPKTNANLGLQYDFEIMGYKSSMRADAVYVGRFYGNLQETPTSRSGDYVKLDASARVQIRKVNVDVFVRNVTNEDSFVFRTGGEVIGYRLRPRTIGLQVAYAF